ncbi:aldo/keto reductase [Salipiger mucosus]|uniref:Oxidoreductase, aldo/keto reductase family n=1 Tax=Salipiger mucosus DSM 16094 TaxID=1123237 RepID=S9SHZ4_9RHOB|nr:aldo/keto reductase [Salipiger mucosus]EPX85959.1 Oxidoreductase, aldo/keto reductase family [Salipiger mucosus DSM 16094]
MKMNPLGRTGMTVSELCLGTMTFGNQTPPEDANAQMDRALDAGINFLDTAEMYPTNPVRAETVGRSEEIIGDWFARTGRRDDWVLATKHTGDSRMLRDGAPISSKTIPETVEASLKRLKTDVIDLYQFHWPNRGSYHFRQNWNFRPWEHPDRAAVLQDMHDCMGALQREVERGTIRAFGLSNESTWGTAMWLRVAEETGGPRVASIQNEYSLLCRMADTDLAELMVHEEVALLPFSPVGAGLLTGKYQDGAVPEGSRMDLNGNLGGRKSERVFPAVDAYLQVARDFGLDPVQMALAWTMQRPFVASSIFGATTMAQLEHLLPAAELTLSEEVLEALDAVNRAHPLPY